MSRLIPTTAAALLLAGTAWAADVHIVKEIDVQFELADIESEVAAEFWADLESDLEEAIAVRVVDQIGEEGSVVSIDIDEVDISNTFQGALGVDSSLTGAIEVKNEADPTKNSYYDLRVTVDESGKFETTDDGIMIVTHEREAVYDAVVNTFADGVVKRLR